MKRILFFIVLVVIASSQAFSQINVTTVEGLDFEEYTTVELNGLSTKQIGDIFFDSTQGFHVWWDGDSFEALSAAAGASDNLGNHIVIQDLVPDVTGTRNLGSSGNRFLAVYAAGAEFSNLDLLAGGRLNLPGNAYISLGTTDTEPPTAKGNFYFDDSESAPRYYDGSQWVTVGTGGGSGDVVGPASTGDNVIPRFDGATGKLLQGSSTTISDAGIMSITAIEAASGGVGFVGNEPNYFGAIYQNDVHFISEATTPIDWIISPDNSTNNLSFISEDVSGSNIFTEMFSMTPGGNFTATGDVSAGGNVEVAGDVLPTNALSKLGNTANSFAIASVDTYFVRDDANDQDWQIDVSIQDLFFSTESVAGSGTFDVNYTLNETGIPANPTDLVDKAYADANYSGTGKIIQDEFSDLPNQPRLNFVGAGVTVTDQPGTNTTQVAILGGGSGETTEIVTQAEYDALPGSKLTNNVTYVIEGPGTSTTASSVSFTPSGNIAASDVQNALEELDGETNTLISGNAGNITNNGNRLDSVVTALGNVGSTPLQQFNYAAPQTSLQAHLADNSIVRLDDADLTIPNDSIPIDGQTIKVVIQQASTGAVNVVEGAGLNFAGYSDGITLNSYPAGVTLMKTSSGNVEVIDYFGSISDYVSIANVYLSRIASADGSDVNTTTNWSNGNGTFSVETTEVRTGTYSLEIENDTGGTGAEYVQFFLEAYGEAIENGDVVRVTYWAKSDDSGQSISTRWDAVDGTSYSALTSTWQQFTRDHTDNGTGTAIRFYLNDTGGGGTTRMWIDDITIEINP